MKKITAVAASSVVLLSTFTALAKGAVPPLPPAPAAAATPAATPSPAPPAIAPAPAPLPPPPAPPPAATPAAPPAGSVPACRLGTHAGIDENDAATATQIVCGELAHADAPVDAHYRVDLGSLGTVVILTVSRERPGEPGSTEDSRQVQLHGIEEVAIAAPRVAASIVSGVPLKETATVDNITSQEARTPKSKPAKLHFALGLLGNFAPFDQSLSPSPGVNLELHSEGHPFELVGNFRAGGRSNDNSNVGQAFASFSMGARYFTNDLDVSPYVGGGLSWSTWDLTISNDFDGSNSGLGAYLEGGVEVLRTSHAHLAVGARLDLPFFSLNGNAMSYTTSSGGYSIVNSSTLYYAPLSIEVRLTF